MTDISNFSEELLFKFAVLYDFSASESEKITLEKTDAGQRKLRKLVNKLYKTWSNEFPEEIRSFIEKGSDAEVIALLKEASTGYNALLEEKKNAFIRELSSLDEDSRAALILMFEHYGYLPCTEVNGDDIKIFIDDVGSIRKELTLKNVRGYAPALVGVSIENCKIVFNKEENRYHICGETETFSDNALIDVNVSFEDAEVKITVFNPCSNDIASENPWDYLASLSNSICTKSDFSEDYCNDNEKLLLPLLRDIVEVGYPNFEDNEARSLCELESLLNRYSCKKAIDLLYKFKKDRSVNKSYFKVYKISRRLSNLLSQKKYEPIWREVFEKIKESQREYQSKAELLCDKKLLNDTRDEIRNFMEAKGYEGTYPDFVKYGEIKNVRLAQSYDMTYFAGFEKNVKYFVHCVESFEENDSLIIQFLCGTALLKKDDEKDVFGCMFNAKGKRFFDVVSHRIPLNSEYDGEVCDLATAVSVTVKKTELLKLDKAEMKAYNGYTVPGFRYFLWIFVIFGGLFGIGMTLVAMLIAANITFLFGTLADVLEMLKSIPWWLILTIGWIGYGGTMGIIETLARRK